MLGWLTEDSAIHVGAALSYIEIFYGQWALNLGPLLYLVIPNFVFFHMSFFIDGLNIRALELLQSIFGFLGILITIYATFLLHTIMGQTHDGLYVDFYALIWSFHLGLYYYL